MKSCKAVSTVEKTVAYLRTIVSAVEPGTLLGSEESLLEQLSVSRASLRQAARLLEQEGWLSVRRGIHGGYFAARPNLDSIERTVGTYLAMMESDLDESAAVGTFLWTEILRRAAAVDAKARHAVITPVRAKVIAVSAQSRFADLVQIELDWRTALLELINSRYLTFLFQVNAIYGKNTFELRSADPDFEQGMEDFVRVWRQAKFMEFDALVDGDGELAALAAQHSRNIWLQRWRGAQQ